MTFLPKALHMAALEYALQDLTGWRYTAHIETPFHLPHPTYRHPQQWIRYVCHENGSVLRWVLTPTHTDIEVLFEDPDDPRYPVKRIYLERCPDTQLTWNQWRIRLMLGQEGQNFDLATQHYQDPELQSLAAAMAAYVQDTYPQAQGRWYVSNGGTLVGRQDSGSLHHHPDPKFLYMLGFRRWLNHLSVRNSRCTSSPCSLQCYIPSSSHERLQLYPSLEGLLF